MRKTWILLSLLVVVVLVGCNWFRHLNLRFASEGLCTRSSRIAAADIFKEQ